MPSQTAPAKAKPRCVYSILNHMVRVSSPPQSWSKAVVCVSTPRMYPRSRYFLGNNIGMRVFLTAIEYPISAAWLFNRDYVNRGGLDLSKEVLWVSVA